MLGPMDKQVRHLSQNPSSDVTLYTLRGYISIPCIINRTISNHFILYSPFSILYSPFPNVPLQIIAKLSCYYYHLS